MLLLAAASLKLYGLNVSAVPRVGPLSAPWVQAVVVLWEIVLGLWLLSGTRRPGAWCAALATFLTFAAVSCYFGWTGVATCGCFGTIKASPWHALAVDVAALTALMIARPEPGALSVEGLRNGAWKVASPALIVALLLGLAAAAGYLAYGSVDLALAKLRGEPLSVSSEYIGFGSGQPGETLSSVVRVYNLTNVPVNVVGGSSDCSCVTTHDLPVEIAPGGSVVLTIDLILPQSQPGTFTRTAVLWTDCETRRKIRLHLGSRIE
jgi:hypothetical protein